MKKKLYHLIDNKWHLPFCSYYYTNLDKIINLETDILAIVNSEAFWWMRRGTATIAPIAEKYIEKRTQSQ